MNYTARPESGCVFLLYEPGNLKLPILDYHRFRGNMKRTFKVFYGFCDSTLVEGLVNRSHTVQRVVRFPSKFFNQFD